MTSSSVIDKMTSSSVIKIMTSATDKKITTSDSIRHNMSSVVNKRVTGNSLTHFLSAIHILVEVCI